MLPLHHTPIYSRQDLNLQQTGVRSAVLYSIELREYDIRDRIQTCALLVRNQTLCSLSYTDYICDTTRTCNLRIRSPLLYSN